MTHGAQVGPLLASTSSKPKKPLIRFKLDVAGSAGDVEEADDEATEVKGEGKILSLPLSQFQARPRPPLSPLCIYQSLRRNGIRRFAMLRPFPWRLRLFAPFWREFSRNRLPLLT